MWPAPRPRRISRRLGHRVPMKSPIGTTAWASQVSRSCSWKRTTASRPTWGPGSSHSPRSARRRGGRKAREVHPCRLVKFASNRARTIATFSGAVERLDLRRVSVRGWACAAADRRRQRTSGHPAAHDIEAAPLVSSLVASRRPRAGQGIARRRPRAGGRGVERGGVAGHGRRASSGGARLMLYHLLFSLHDFVSVLNVTRYITFRTAAASITAMAISLVVGPILIRRLKEFQFGQVIRPGGPGQPSSEGRHADDGRAADPDRGHRADAAVGGPDQRLHLDRGDLDDAVRRDRVPRRLPEDHAPLASRAAGPATRWAARSSSALGVGVTLLVLAQPRSLQHAPDLSVLQAAHSRSRAGSTCRLPRSCWWRRRTR